MADSIVKTTRAYEAWLARNITAVPRDLRLKHQEMAASPFSFFRATFYRWAEQYPALCPELAAAPALLAVGDLHVENFGTWRDAEGRLVWGINDFDEAAMMPYTIDLVRLATSAIVAAKVEALKTTPEAASSALLAGYRTGLGGVGAAYVLEEEHGWLRDLALGELRQPEKFWARMEALPRCATPPSKTVRKLLARHMPERGLKHQLHRRVAGLGSLGRERYVALADWHGGQVAREAKALLPSAWHWAHGVEETKIFCGKLVRRAVRCPDPTVVYEEGWVLRRLSPHCSRIPLEHLPRERDEERLFKAMGHETANVHLGTRKAIEAVKRDLEGRGEAWLAKAAKVMANAVYADWKAWKAR
jgi:hypothetical protein